MPSPLFCGRCTAAFCGECTKLRRAAGGGPWSCPSCLLLDARGVEALRCDFCKREGVADPPHNRLLVALHPRVPEKAVVTHLLCETWSSGIAAAAGQSTGEGTERQRLLWEEFSRGRWLKCSICDLSGATSGCMVTACKLTYHVQCAVAASSGVTFFEKTLCLACPKHGEHLGAGSRLTAEPAPPPLRAGMRRAREE